MPIWATSDRPPLLDGAALDVVEAPLDIVEIPLDVLEVALDVPVARLAMLDEEVLVVFVKFSGVQ